MNIERLLLNNDFEMINQMLEEGKISLADLITHDEDSIAILARNLNALKNVNIDELIAAVGELKNASLIFVFAKNAIGLNKTQVNTLANYVIAQDNILKIIAFAEEVPNAPILELGNKVKETRNFIFIRLFINGVSDIPESLMDDFVKIIFEYALRTPNGFDLFLAFLDELSGRSLSVSTYNFVADNLIKMGNVHTIFYFASMEFDIPNETWTILACPFVTTCFSFIDTFYSCMKEKTEEQRNEILTDAAILTNNFETMINFAKKYQGTNKTKIAQFLIETKNFKWIYRLAKEVKGISEETMKDIVTFVSKTQSLEFIYLFLSNIELSIDNIEILVESIEEIENLEIIPYFLLILGNKNSKKIDKVKLTFVLYLNRLGNHDWMLNYNPDIHKELEEKLLNSDDEVLNPFIDVIEPDKQLQKLYYE